LFGFHLVLFWLSLFAYGAEAGLQLGGIAPKSPVRSALFAGILLHGLFLAVRWFLTGHAPMAGLFESLTVFSFCSALSAFLLCRTEATMPAWKPLSILVLLPQAGAALVDKRLTPLYPALDTPWFATHVGFSFLGYGLFAAGLALGDDERPAGRLRAQAVHLPAGPDHLDRLDTLRRAQAERERQLALRAVAGAGLDDGPALAAARQAQADARADPVAVGLRAHEPHAQPGVLVAAVVAQQHGRTTVGGHGEIEVAVPVHVGVRGPARDHRPRQRRTDPGDEVLESLVPEVAEQVRRLRVADLGLDLLDVVRHVAAHREDVEAAVEVEVEEERRKGEREQRGLPDRRGGRLVDEEAVALVVVQAQHLVREVPDQERRPAASAVVGRVRAHAGARQVARACSRTCSCRRACRTGPCRSTS